MNEAVAHFAVKSIGLSKVGGRKTCTLLEAVRHNLREIQAELGAVGRINPARSASNTLLAGPSTAAEVQAQAAALLNAQGIDTNKLRRDHCQAIEAVFSLPSAAAVTDPTAYFAQCLEWVAGALHLPVLSAVLHRDEQAPHLHVLLLPVKGRVYLGSSPIDRMELKRLREAFFAQVAGPAGLKRQDAKVRGNVKQWAVAAVLSRCEAMGLPNTNGVLWPVLESAIMRDPTPALLALEIDVNSIRPGAAQAQPNPIGIGPNPIGFAELEPKHRTLSCVGFAPSTPSPTLQRPIGSPPELRTERLRRARAAEQSAMARHKRTAPAAPSATNTSEVQVVRDEHVHDLSAWD